MDYITLGNTGIRVSRLCFGALTVGPLQANMSPQAGGDIILEALRGGINFIDTAEIYKTYPHIAYALNQFSGEVVIASKTYAYTAEMAKSSVELARQQTGRDVIDIFLLHEQEGEATLRGHNEALLYLLDCKRRGIVRAVGLSTHHIAGVLAGAYSENIDIIHPLINHAGIGIADGNIDDMLKAVQTAYNKGKGIYSMKPLGGGNLINDYNKCLDFVLNIPYIHSIAMGMQSVSEVLANICIFEGMQIPSEVSKGLKNQRRALHIEDWCNGCGSCVAVCYRRALYLREGKARVDEDKCMLCGYCSRVCREFGIKIV